MAGFSSALDRLSEAFGRLPGIGAKSAERLAHHILKCSDDEALALAEAIREAKEKVRHCQACFHLTEAGEPLCSVCRDPSRDASIVCVVGLIGSWFVYDLLWRSPLVKNVYVGAVLTYLLIMAVNFHLTKVISGRAALGVDAIRAVREDW